MDNKERQTKQQILQEFLEDINNVLRKVDTNTATGQDYQLLQEYFEHSGLEQEMIDNLLKEGNFDGWVSFYNERSKPSEEQNTIAVRAVLGQIRGMGTAVKEFIAKEISEL